MNQSADRGTTTHLESLQYLRGLAAMMVVYYHAVVQIDQVTGVRVLPMAGSSGVDIFFVLSGFVMWWTTAGRQTAAGDFLLRRVIRIAPLYWMFTLLAAGIALFLPHLLRSTRFDAVHVAASLAFVPWWNPLVPHDDPIALTPIIVPGWTLNVEMAFYLLFAIALQVSERVRAYALAALLLAVFILARTVFIGTPLQFYGTDLLAEFMAGVVLAIGLSRLSVRAAAPWWVLLIISFAALWWFDEHRPDGPQALSLGLPALLCVIAALQIERARELPRSGLLSLLGNASYSIYVSHIFMIPAARMISGAIGFDMATAYGAVFVVGAMLAAACFGIAVHVMIERPLLARINALLRGRKRPPGAAEFAGS